jgi:hypothetical protein
MWWRPETREPMEHVVRPKLPAAVGTRNAASPVRPLLAAALYAARSADTEEKSAEARELVGRGSIQFNSPPGRPAAKGRRVNGP